MLKIELLFIITIIFSALGMMLLYIGSRIDKAKLEAEIAENKILKDKIRYLDFELRCYKTSRVYQVNNTDKVSDNDLREAVKFAMKKSHPDNGGDAVEFDKFRKLYERIK